MSALKDLSGMRFGYLTVLKRVGSNKHKNALWECVCDCGNHKVYPSGKLTSGRATNCGCKTSEIKSKNASKHGITAGGAPRTLVIWNGMKARCLNPKATSYKNYGARGIRICDEWMIFENFHNWAIENGYDDLKEIDRIDNDGNYCPENCRWVSKSENRCRQRQSRYVNVDGLELNLAQWSRRLNVSRYVIRKYMNMGDEKFIQYVHERMCELKQKDAA